MKAYNRDTAMCWECYNCVKTCPQQAIAVRGYADFIPIGANVTPLRGTEDILVSHRRIFPGNSDRYRRGSNQARGPGSGYLLGLPGSPLGNVRFLCRSAFLESGTHDIQDGRLGLCRESGESRGIISGIFCPPMMYARAFHT